MADTALRTADSGYLTRRLVDVSQEVIILEDDCGTTEGLEVFEITSGPESIEPMKERLIGRYLVEDFCDENGDVLVSKDKMMDDADAEHDHRPRRGAHQDPLRPQLPRQERRLPQVLRRLPGQRQACHRG